MALNFIAAIDKKLPIWYNYTDSVCYGNIAVSIFIYDRIGRRNVAAPAPTRSRIHGQQKGWFFR